MPATFSKGGEGDPTYWMKAIDQLPGYTGTLVNRDGAFLHISRELGTLSVRVDASLIWTELLTPLAANVILGEWCINRFGWCPVI